MEANESKHVGAKQAVQALLVVDEWRKKKKKRKERMCAPQMTNSAKEGSPGTGWSFCACLRAAMYWRVLL